MDQAIKWISVLSQGLQTNFWGLGCPVHCHHFSTSSFLLIFLVGWLLGTLSLASYLGLIPPLVPDHRLVRNPPPAASGPAAERLHLYLYERGLRRREHWAFCSSWSSSPCGLQTFILALAAVQAVTSWHHRFQSAPRDPSPAPSDHFSLASAVPAPSTSVGRPSTSPLETRREIENSFPPVPSDSGLPVDSGGTSLRGRPCPIRFHHRRRLMCIVRQTSLTLQIQP